MIAVLQLSTSRAIQFNTYLVIFKMKVRGFMFSSFVNSIASDQFLKSFDGQNDLTVRILSMRVQKSRDATLFNFYGLELATHPHFCISSKPT